MGVFSNMAMHGSFCKRNYNQLTLNNGNINTASIKIFLFLGANCKCSKSFLVSNYSNFREFFGGTFGTSTYGALNSSLKNYSTLLKIGVGLLACIIFSLVIWSLVPSGHQSGINIILSGQEWAKIRKKCNLGKPEAALKGLLKFVQTERRVKKKFQNTLILAFQAKSCNHPATEPHMYNCTIFPFLAHCVVVETTLYFKEK